MISSCLLVGSIAVSVLFYNGFMKLKNYALVTVEFLKVPENAANLFIIAL